LKALWREWSASLKGSLMGHRRKPFGRSSRVSIRCCGHSAGIRCT